MATSCQTAGEDRLVIGAAPRSTPDRHRAPDGWLILEGFATEWPAVFADSPMPCLVTSDVNRLNEINTPRAAAIADEQATHAIRR